MSAHDLFRLPLSEALRHHKRTELFRHPLFGVAELADPIQPSAPFVFQSMVPLIEVEWHFSREAVPDYIRLSTGKAARERSLTKLIEEYDLPPSERFKRVEDSLKIERYDTSDPDTWEIGGFFCSIQVPQEISGEGIPVFWCGNRSTALTDPRVRPWFFDPRTKVSHGQEAVTLAKEALGKVRGLS